MDSIAIAFLRNRGDVLFVRYPSGDADGPWTGIEAPVDDEQRPLEAVQAVVTRSLGVDVDAIELAYAGESIETSADDDDEEPRTVYPFMFDTATRSIGPVERAAATEWCSPTELLDRPTVPGLWTAYRAVGPTPASIAADEEHGSAELSIRALSALRDAAATAIGFEPVAETAQELVAARPSMAVVSNRVHRVMSEADRTPEAVHDRAVSAIDAAADADARAAQAAAERIDGPVLTLSRSGTVLETLVRSGAGAIVAESRPACEGVQAAEQLARSGLDVTLTTDAAAAVHVHDGSVSAVLVGADTVLPTGDVVNKVGTLAVVLAAEAADVPRYVVAAQDKIAPEPAFHPVEGSASDVYDGEESIGVSNPTFDRTPAGRISGVITESGLLSDEDIQMIAAQHRANRNWE